nr:zinc finger, CCHC-type, retrotransposon Gag domain protein [Tanacetum cinerariifolium]
VGINSKGFLEFFDCPGSRQGVEDLREAEDITMSTYLVNRSPSATIRFKTPIDMLGFFGWLASIKQGMLEPVKVKCIFLRCREGIMDSKLWRLDDVTSKVVLYKNIDFNESEEYKKTFIGSGVGTGSMQVLHEFEFEVEPLGDHTFEAEPQENFDQGAGLQEVQTQYLMDYQSACDREQHLTCELFGYKKDSNEDAFAVATAEIWITKGLLVKAKGNVPGLEIIRDQSGNTLRVSQSKIHNEKLVLNTVIGGYSIRKTDSSMQKEMGTSCPDATSAVVVLLLDLLIVTLPIQSTLNFEDNAFEKEEGETNTYYFPGVHEHNKYTKPIKKTKEEANDGWETVGKKTPRRHQLNILNMIKKEDIHHNSNITHGHQARGDTRIITHLPHVTFVGNFIQERRVTGLLVLALNVERLAIWLKIVRKMPPRRSNRVNNEADPTFTAAVAQAVADLLPTLTARITDEIRQNKNNRNNGNRRNARRVNTEGLGNDEDAQPTDIHVWLERFQNRIPKLSAQHPRQAYKQAKGGDAYVVTLSWNDFRDIFFLQYFPYSEKEKCEREYKSIRQLPEETSTDLMKRFLRLAGFLGAKAGTQEEQAKHFKWGLNDFVLDRILNTEFTDVAQVANAARILKSSVIGRRMKEKTRGTETAIVYDRQKHHHRGLIREPMIEGIVTDMATVADMATGIDMTLTDGVVIDRAVTDMVTAREMVVRRRGVTKIS